MDQEKTSQPCLQTRRNGTRHSSKSKLGCRTCKVRRIKCDETKPSCRRCSSTGRVCDGYGIWTCHRPSLQVRQVVPVLPAAGQPLAAEDSLHLEYFLRRTAVKLPGSTTTPFWDQLVVQAAFLDPAVFHASLALSGTHRHDGLLRMQRERGQRQTGSACNTFSMRQYGKAVARLVGKSYSFRASLVTCIIFVCMEMVRGNYRSGCQLIQSGLGLAACLPTGHHSDEWLIEALLTLNLQAAQFGQMSLSGLRFPQYAKSPAACKAQARSELNVLLRGVMELNQNYRRRLIMDEGASCAMISQRKELLASLDAWRHNLTTFKYDDSIMAEISMQSLSLHYRMIRTMAEVCLSTETELVYDTHIGVFRDIVETSRTFLSTVWSPEIDKTPYAHTVDASHCTVGAGFVPPLLFTALKCRDSTIRAQAVGLLKSGKGKEVAMSGRIAIAVANSVISIETRGRCSANHVCDDWLLPADKDRVRDVRIDMFDEPVDTVQFTYTKPGADGSLKVYRQRCKLT